MLKGRCTKYGSLILYKVVLEHLDISEGDLFVINTDADQTGGNRVLYFLKTYDRNGTVTIEKRNWQFYIRLNRYFTLLNVEVPCSCDISKFKFQGQEGFKVELVNIPA
jgi:hypothetical protein